jgi:hypothetical protein
MKTITATLAALIAALLLAGCVPWTVKPGSDPVVVNAEQLSKESVLVIDDFVKFVDRNWSAAGEDLRSARDLAAKSGPVYIRALDKAVREYKANRTPGNQQVVADRIAALRQLLEVIREYNTKKST